MQKSKKSMKPVIIILFRQDSRHTSDNHIQKLKTFPAIIYHCPRQQIDAENLLTNKLTCAMLKCMDNERGSFDASVRRTLCEILKNLNIKPE